MTLDGVLLTRASGDAGEVVLTSPAMKFLLSLHREFSDRRDRLLAKREEFQRAVDEGTPIDELTAVIDEARSGSWRVPPAPPDLHDRVVEITGPAERRMMINALNSGASGFMADLEDAMSPTWSNCLRGQANLVDAVRRQIAFQTPTKSYELARESTTTLQMRPRGWHLPEAHCLLDGREASAALFDAGLFLFHNAAELLTRGSGPYLYLPKLESHEEAVLWHDVFSFAEGELYLPAGSIRATVLIETVPAALEMEEILWGLGEHAIALNAGRWDYLFSLVKVFRRWPQYVLPDRGQVTMDVPFMRRYADLLVRTCHRHNAHAIGGMAAFVPSRNDPEGNELAFSRVRDDKRREAEAGFDGTWVAHPDLVAVARGEFESRADRPQDQVGGVAPASACATELLLDISISGATRTMEGLLLNVDTGLRYLSSWLEGNGAVALRGLMEDAATAEICRSQLWQWIHHGVRLETGEVVTSALVRQALDEAVERALNESLPRVKEAAGILDDVTLGRNFPAFMLTDAYRAMVEDGA